MVGAGTSDDAAVYRLNDQQALILTTDFFMPIGTPPARPPARCFSCFGCSALRACSCVAP